MNHCCFGGCTPRACGCCVFAYFHDERFCTEGGPLVLSWLDTMSHPLPRPCIAEREREPAREVER